MNELITDFHGCTISKLIGNCYNEVGSLLLEDSTLMFMNQIQSSSTNTSDICLKMLQQWRVGGRVRTWRRLIEVLEKCDRLKFLADKIKDALCEKARGECLEQIQSLVYM